MHAAAIQLLVETLTAGPAARLADGGPCLEVQSPRDDCEEHVRGRTINGSSLVLPAAHALNPLCRKLFHKYTYSVGQEIGYSVASLVHIVVLVSGQNVKSLLSQELSAMVSAEDRRKAALGACQALDPSVGRTTSLAACEGERMSVFHLLHRYDYDFLNYY